MKRVIFTICTDDRFKKWYPKLLANSLAPFGWNVICYIDKHHSLYAKADNLYFADIKILIPDYFMYDLHNEWYRMLFFNQDMFPGEALFVSVDSIFLNDPADIVNYIHVNNGPNGHYILATPIGYNQNIMTNLMYVNHEHGYLKFLWDKFSRYGNGKHITEYGLIKDYMRDFFGDLYNAVYLELPPEFMVPYKTISQMDDPVSKLKNYHSLTMYGEFKFEDVVKNKQPMYELLTSFLPEEAKND